VDADHGDVQDARRVDRAVVVGGQEAALYLADTLLHDLLRYAEIDSVAGQEVGLELHDVIEAGQGIALGVVGDHKVDLAARNFVELVSKEDLADLHVYADDHLTHLGLRGSVKDTRVGVGIEEAVLVIEFLFPLFEPGEPLLFLFQNPVDLFFPSLVMDDAHGYGLFIKVLQLHMSSPVAIVKQSERENHPWL